MYLIPSGKGTQPGIEEKPQFPTSAPAKHSRPLYYNIPMGHKNAVTWEVIYKAITHGLLAILTFLSVELYTIGKESLRLLREHETRISLLEAKSSCHIKKD